LQVYSTTGGEGRWSPFYIELKTKHNSLLTA
jgi:hypothetical protein